MNNPPHVLSLYVYSSTGRHVYTGYKTNAIVRRKRDNRIDHRLVQAISNKLFKIRKSTTCFRDNLEILHTCSVTPCRPGGGGSLFFRRIWSFFSIWAFRGVSATCANESEMDEGICNQGPYFDVSKKECKQARIQSCWALFALLGGWDNFPPLTAT